MKRFAIIFCVACALMPVASVSAQSLEEQLRTQLRDTHSQLQDIQGAQAQWQAQKASLEQERDQARKALEAAQADLNKRHPAAAPDLAAPLAAAQAASARAEAEQKRLQALVTDAEANLRAQVARSNSLTLELNTAQAQVTTCTSKNQQLYAVANEILDAYSHLSVGTMLASRQPFAASARVKLENAAQAYGDRLYDQRYDPHALSPAQPSSAGKP